MKTRIIFLDGFYHLELEKISVSRQLRLFSFPVFKTIKEIWWCPISHHRSLEIARTSQLSYHHDKMLELTFVPIIKMS